MKLVNLTPHKISIVTNSGTVTIEPSGQVARVSSDSVLIGSVTDTKDGIGIPVFKRTFGDEEGNVIGCRGLIAANI